MIKRKWKSCVFLCCILFLQSGTVNAVEEFETEQYIDETEMVEMYEAKPLDIEEKAEDNLLTIEEIEEIEADSCNAEIILDSGVCGENASWMFSADGVLKISGSGAMYDYSFGNAPWNKWSDSILKIDMSDSEITYLGTYSFWGCDNNQSVIFSEKTEEIGAFCFQEQYGLKEIDFPDRLQTIREYAFFNTGLTKINITQNIKQIDGGAFRSTEIQSILIDNNNKYFSVLNQVLYSQDGTSLVMYPPRKSDEIFYVPDQVRCIEDWAFSNSRLKEIVVNDNLTKIGACAFQDSDLQAINIPGSVEYIGYGAFKDCFYLQEVSFAEECQIKYLGSDCFMQCNMLTTIALPKGIETIGAHEFQFCRSLSSILIPQSVNTIHEYAFQDCASEFIIQGFANSYAQVWANTNNIPFISISHEHSFVQFIAKEPNCTSAGAIRNSCNCGVKKADVAIDALGHDSIYDVSASRESTCSKNGVKIYRCSRCGLTTGTEILPRKEHVAGGSTYTVDIATESLIEIHNCVSCGKGLSRDEVAPVLAAGELEELEEIGLAVGERLAVDTWCAPVYVNISSNHPAITVSKLDDRYVMLTANASNSDVLLSFVRNGKNFSYHVPAVIASTQMQVTGAHAVSVEQTIELSVSRNTDATDPIGVYFSDSSVAMAEVVGSKIKVTGILPGRTELIVTAGTVVVSYSLTVEKMDNNITAPAAIVKKHPKKGFYLKVSQTGDGSLSFKSDNKKVKVNKKGYVKVAKKFKGKVRITVRSEETENCKSAQKVIMLTIK